MWNFNKVGRVINTRTIQRGLKVELQWVWPWKRSTLNLCKPYLVTVTNPQGIRVHHQEADDKLCFKQVVLDYYRKSIPLEMHDEDVQVWAFNLETSLEQYLERFLPDGDFLVHVPVSEKASRNFWKKRVGVEESNASHLDCAVTNITGYDKPAIYLASRANPQQPGRYLLITVSDGHVKTTVNLL
jgi:hypothetical protein